MALKWQSGYVRLPFSADIVLVAVTGYRPAEDRQRMQEAGFDHYLVKPADFEKLRASLGGSREEGDVMPTKCVE